MTESADIPDDRDLPRLPRSNRAPTGQDHEQQGTWTVAVTPSGLYAAPCGSADGRWLATPSRVSWTVALLLVLSGQVEQALLYRRKGFLLLEALRARGVSVIDEGAPSTLVRRVRFVRQNRKAA